MTYLFISFVPVFCTFTKVTEMMKFLRKSFRLQFFNNV